MAASVPVAILPEQPADIPDIRRIHQSAFPTPLEARLVDALRGAGQLSLSLVARMHDRTVAHVALSPVTLDDYPDLRLGVGLGPIAVVPDMQRQGVGSRLMRAALEGAAEAGYRFVVVLGEPAYYGRFGFLPGTRFGLKNHYGAGDEFMALELQGGTLPYPAGLVRYSPEFNSVAP
jgi:putative acetyltransferase